MHSLVNYARAKQQATNIMKILKERQRDADEPDVKIFFQKFLKNYVPHIESEEIEILFEAIVKDT
jgi:hypothetical protein